MAIPAMTILQAKSHEAVLSTTAETLRQFWLRTRGSHSEENGTH